MDPLKRRPPRASPAAPAHRLPRWQYWLLGAAGALLLATGAVWLVLHHAIGNGPDDLPSPLEAWSLRVHGFAAFIGLFVLGVLAGAHIPRGWQLSRRAGWAGQRQSGAGLCALAAALAATGYLLYYFAPETVRPALGWVHAAIGFAMAGLVLRHRRRAGPGTS